MGAILRVNYRCNPLEQTLEGRVVACDTVYSETGSKNDEIMYVVYNMYARKFVYERQKALCHHVDSNS